MMINNEESIVSTEDGPPQIDFDEALQEVGASHFYQKRAFLIFGLQWFVANWILLSPTYLLRDPEIDCQGDQTCILKCNSSDSYTNKECQDYICVDNGANMKFLTGSTITTAFDTVLACNNSYMKSVIQSIVYVGSMLGFFIFSFAADNYGRKISLCLAWIAVTIGAFTLGFAQSLTQVGIGMFLTGFGVNPAITIHYSFINEHTLGHFRDIQNVGVQIFFGVGEIVYVFIAKAYPNWRTQVLYWYCMPILILNFAHFLIYESPKFAYSKNKEESVAILNNIAEINKRPKIQSNRIQNNILNKENNSRVYSILDLLKYKSQRWVFLFGLMMFFGIQIIYYGISFASENIGLEFYMNNLIIAIFETAAYAVTDTVVFRLRRRIWIVIGFVTVGIMALSYSFMPNEKSWQFVQVAIAGLMRFIICFVWALAYIYISELFPTVVRSLALGLISAGGTVGSIMCSFIKDWALQLGINPIVAFGMIGMCAGLFTIPLRETFGKPLIDKIPEDEKRVKKSMIVDYEKIDEFSQLEPSLD